MSRTPDAPRWIGLREALYEFAMAEHGTQSQRHIKPLHWYTASRLVVEGGFHPDEVMPRPPFRVETRRGQHVLHHDSNRALAGERTVLGGLKTKDVDVVVSKTGIGPCIAISMKGTLNAFRNLANRMEEAAGDCTNLHITYPALVYSFWNVIRANIEGTAPQQRASIINVDGDGSYRQGDIAIDSSGLPSNQVARYHFALERLSFRSDVRDEPSKYEAIGFTLVVTEPPSIGDVFEPYPSADDPLRHEHMFTTIYKQYDLRFVYQAPALATSTRRLEWSPESPAFMEAPTLDYEPRIRSVD